MLKKDAMAKKVAKFMLSEAVKDSSDSHLKESVLDALEKAYIAGFDLAIQECKDDNSNSGLDMAFHLETLTEEKYV